MLFVYFGGLKRHSQRKQAGETEGTGSELLICSSRRQKTSTTFEKKIDQSPVILNAASGAVLVPAGLGRGEGAGDSLELAHLRFLQRGAYLPHWGLR